MGSPNLNAVLAAARETASAGCVGVCGWVDERVAGVRAGLSRRVMIITA